MANDPTKIKVTITPSSGDPVELEATGNSVAEVLAAAGRSPDRMNIFVNGKPATLDTHVTGDDEIKLEERAAGS